MKHIRHAELLGLRRFPRVKVVDNWLNRFVSASSNRYETVRTRVFIISVFLVVLLGGPTLFSYGFVGVLAYSGHFVLALVVLLFPPKVLKIQRMIDIFSAYILVECSFLLYFNPAALSGSFFWSPATIAMFTIFYSPKKALLPSALYLALILAAGLRLGFTPGFQFHDYFSSETIGTIFLTVLSSQIFLAGVILTFERAKIRTEQELKIEHERRLEARRMVFVRELIGNVAHEINNPLAIIQASVLRLERAGLTKGSREYRDLISNIEEAVSRIRSVRDGLGLFAAGDNKEKLEAIDVRSLFKRVIQQTKNLGLYSHLAFSDRSQGLQILCRQNQIGTALVALIVNAQEAIEGRIDGRIVIEAFHENQNLCLKVTDNGKGIPDEMRDKIFLPFFSSHSRDGIRGLGLAVSRGTIAEHGGRIDLENVIGKTCFTIRLPLSIANQVMSRPERRLS